MPGWAEPGQLSRPMTNLPSIGRGTAAVQPWFIHGVSRCGARTLRGKLLRKLGMTHLQPQPSHPKMDVAAQEARAGLAAGALPPEVAGKVLEVWFQDEPSAAVAQLVAAQKGPDILDGV